MTELAEATAGGAPELPESWRAVLAEETGKPYYAQLTEFLAAERAEHEVFPPAGQEFSALEATAYEDVKVLILGQDPYHDNGQAHGMSFSVLPGVKTPPSLRNIYKELGTDLGLTVPDNGYLMPWAEQGVLLLNAVLTVRAHEANSHKNKGWEKFTDAVIKAVSAREEPCVFVLWGGYAKKKLPLIDAERHVVVQGAHPSPLSAKLFLGSKPFSQINEALEGFGQKAIDWQIPNLKG
ncbi:MULTISPECIES: uracil-DNA glycosylase [Kitasatospora]|uniref:Uracil-DNA glycosylase n=1 Tax=Kitasatospora setae (strain ATCC 33774 / DSM 43861 / JCM 3304 / KCC A-0304 / NBRC 14216 / KM-6054) TaxID=452652 RepID=E4NBM0_KITSK|nr:uracil-DNA glycosylase [Kitasatospora setae]BAJ28601.1 putative uracil-DNA glycosylase [Kitasatospora setae KM-6054]